MQLSTDPLNPSGKNSFSQSGLVNEKSVGVIRTPEGNVQLLSKTVKNANKPAKAVAVSTFKPHAAGRRVAAAASKAAAGYREDLRKDAVIKASTLARVDKPKKTRAAKTNGRR